MRNSCSTLPHNWRGAEDGRSTLLSEGSRLSIYALQISLLLTKSWQWVLGGIRLNNMIACSIEVHATVTTVNSKEDALIYLTTGLLLCVEDGEVLQDYIQPTRG